jgi:hypothetical protein
MSRALRSLAVVVVVSLLMGGSAVAGQKLARNSVASPQVKNGSLAGKDLKDRTVTGRDVRDRSLSGADLRDGSVGPVDLATGTVPTYFLFDETIDATTEVIDVPGFSRIRFDCTSSSVGIFVGFGDGDPSPDDPRQSHYIGGSDIADQSPVGAASVTGSGGGVGFGYGTDGGPPGSGVIVQGQYWGRSDTRSAYGTWTLPSGGSPCRVRFQMYVVDLPTPRPVPRAAGPVVARSTGAAQCEVESGAGYCRLR